MRIINKSYQTAIALLLCLFAAGVVFQSCEEKEEFQLDAYGPSKVERCGEISFRGSKLDEVEKIYFPAGNYDEKWAVGKSDFISQSPEKITVKIPCDYPFNEPGFVKVIHSGGKEYTMHTRFLVLSEIAVDAVAVVDLGKIYEGEILEPGAEILVYGKSLKLVDSVIFANGVGIDKKDFIYRNEYGDDNKYIVFKLPTEIPTGSLFKLKVPAHDKVADFYLDVCEIFLPTPIASNFKSADAEPIRVCRDMTFSVERLDRLDYDPVSKEIKMVFGLTPLTGEIFDIDEIADKASVSVSLPNYMPGGESAVKLYSFGKLVDAKGVFSVETFTPNEEQLYSPEPIPNVASPRVTVYGKNLCAVKGVKYVINDKGETIQRLKGTPYCMVNEEEGKIDLWLVNYLKGEPITILLLDNSSIELRAPEY